MYTKSHIENSLVWSKIDKYNNKIHLLIFFKIKPLIYAYILKLPYESCEVFNKNFFSTLLLWNLSILFHEKEISTGNFVCKIRYDLDIF